MGTASKTNFLITEVNAKVKKAFSTWHVGTSERDDAWCYNKWAEIVVFNVLDRNATQAAYEYCVQAGMKGQKPLGGQPNYLYLYNADGILPDGFVWQ